MIESQASRTAMMVAAYRARASARAQPVCQDAWAAALSGSDGAAIADRFDAVYPHMELWVALRTAYLDAQVAHWTGARGFGQVVILGAGLDTRAARLARPGVRFFEVDHPATQAGKLARLRELSGYPVDAATYAPCNFEQDDFVDALREAGFRCDAPAVILWEGVVAYLTEPAVRATLARIASRCDDRSVLLFDYLMKRMAYGVDLPERDAQTLELVADLGEPVRFGINDAVPLLVETGFVDVRTISFDEICLALTATYDRARMFRFQHIARASRTRHGLIE